jgi:hypothetical protein
MGRPDRNVAKLRKAAAEEAASGRLWRAKELLQQAASRGYDAELFEQLGVVLLRMYDTLEAGKWLFLSGRRIPEYGEAIATFLERHGSHSGKRLYASFPPSARLGGPEEYPEPLATELATLGVPRNARRAAIPSSPTVMQALAAIAALVYVVACFTVGMNVVTVWLFKNAGSVLQRLTGG